MSRSTAACAAEGLARCAASATALAPSKTVGMAASTALPTRAKSGFWESRGNTRRSQATTFSRTCCTSSSAFFEACKVFAIFLRHFTANALPTTSLSSTPKSNNSEKARCLLKLCSIITHERFSFRRRDSPRSGCFVHALWLRFLISSRSRLVETSTLSGRMQSLDAQNSSSSSTRGQHRSTQPSWPKYIRIATTSASARGGASESVSRLTCSANAAHCCLNSAALHCPNRSIVLKIFDLAPVSREWLASATWVSLRDGAEAAAAVGVLAAGTRCKFLCGEQGRPSM
mmetsp:Transcript_61300/g.171415  ORF Transcript_61300/g.171415 Transcript_61300/m.171415 type:complete len:287 (+) Transcript_61300:325-1185(+)